MAKIRTIKPELFRHEELFEAELESSMPLRLVFAGLFTCCDREGRFRWKPRQLKLDILPYDNIDFAPLLEMLHAKGFIAKYEKEGEYFGYIPSWHKHQTINTREPKSKLPDPNNGNLIKPKGTAAQSSLDSHSQSVRTSPACSNCLYPQAVQNNTGLEKITNESVSFVNSKIENAIHDHSNLCKEQNTPSATKESKLTSNKSLHVQAHVIDIPIDAPTVIPADAQIDIYGGENYLQCQSPLFELPIQSSYNVDTLQTKVQVLFGAHWETSSQLSKQNEKNYQTDYLSTTENKSCEHEILPSHHLHVQAHATHVRAHLEVEVEMEGKWKGNGSGRAKRSTAHAVICMQSNLSHDISSLSSQLTASSETVNLENHSEAKQNLLSITAKPLISIPLKNNTEFPIEQSQLDEWKSLYPRIDILQTLRHIRGWNLANPNKRKTLTGINKHITTWLSKEETNSGLNRHSRYPPYSSSAYSASRVQALHDHNLSVAEQWLNQSEEIIINGETLYDT